MGQYYANRSPTALGHMRGYCGLLTSVSKKPSVLCNGNFVITNIRLFLGSQKPKVSLRHAAEGSSHHTPPIQSPLESFSEQIGPRSSPIHDSGIRPVCFIPLHLATIRWPRRIVALYQPTVILFSMRSITADRSSSLL